MKCWCVVAFLVAVALPEVVISQETCSGAKVYRTCGSACPATCDNPSPICTFQCVTGCFCPRGMVEQSDGTCVEPTQCSATPTSLSTPACPGGKVHVQCMNTCPVTCDNPNPPFCTSFVCIRGCECPQGLALHNDMCIRPDQCPTATPTALSTPACPGGKVHVQCMNTCPVTCDNPNPPFCTSLVCIRGCECPRGLALHNDMCIRPDQCPTATTTTATAGVTTIHPTQPACPSGMTFNSCGTACPLTCEYPFPRPCPRICSRGCFCPTGLLQYNGACVEQSQCPTTTPAPSTTDAPQAACTNGRIFSTCGTACPITCSNFRNPPMVCPAVCMEGCFCPQGQVQNGEHCVTTDQCSTTTTTATAGVATIHPTQPTCPSGMTFNSCGTACPLTCEYPYQRPCTRNCVPDCFCPTELLQYNGACVERSQCPTGNTTTSVAMTPTTPTCQAGKVYKTCGPICPQTCGPSFCFSLRCATGCFCPDGTFEHEGQCVTQCPTTTSSTPTPTPSEVTTTEPTTREPTTAPVCANGRVYETCGSACPITCQNMFGPPRPCPLICVQGCFCPSGTVADGDRCVNRDQCISPCATVRCPSQCVVNSNGNAVCVPDCRFNNGNCSATQLCTRNNYSCTAGRYCDLNRFVNCTNPCATNTCSGSTRCVVSNMTREAKCVPSCGNNGGCNSDQACEIRTLGCRSGSRQPCDSTFFRMCKDVPFVSCGRDAFLACDSEWTYCLQQNVSRRASCVASCLSRNGNCKDDTVCVTTISGDSPRLQCLDQDDLPSGCPAGQTMSQCGNACQETCETHLQGPRVCPLICGPPACVCPRGLVLFRDRCVDPRLCYILMKYPPAINPLPVVNSKSVLLNVVTSHVTQEAFDMVQSNFLSSVQSTLTAMTNHRVHTRLHGIYTNTTPATPTLIIVVEVSGDQVSREYAQSYADILNQNLNLLVIQIDKVQPQEVIYVDNAPSSPQGLSDTAIIGIAVGSAVVGLCFMTIWIALVACCCVMNRRMNTKAYRQQSPTPSTKAFVFSDMSPEDDSVMTQPVDPDKGKLIKESLMY